MFLNTHAAFYQVAAACKQDLGVERLRHIVIGTVVQTLQCMRFCAQSCQENYWYMACGKVAFKHVTHLNAGHYRHHHIAYNQFRLQLGGLFKSLMAVIRCDDIIIWFEDMFQHLHYLVVIFHNKYSCGLLRQVSLGYHIFLFIRTAHSHINVNSLASVKCNIEDSAYVRSAFYRDFASMSVYDIVSV